MNFVGTTDKFTYEHHDFSTLNRADKTTGRQQLLHFRREKALAACQEKVDHKSISKMTCEASYYGSM